MSCQTDVRPPIGLTFSAWHDRKIYQRNIWQDLEIFRPSSKLSNRCHVKPPSIFLVLFDWGITPQVPHWNLNHGNISLGSTPSVPQEIWIGSAKGFVGSCHWLGDYSFSSPWSGFQFNGFMDYILPTKIVQLCPTQLAKRSVSHQ